MQKKFQVILGGKMNTAVQKQEVAVVTPGNVSTWTQEQFDLLKGQFCQDLSDGEFKVFTYAVQRTGLDPFMRQIYAVKRKGKMCIQVGIDGYRLVAERTGAYAGNDDPVLDNEKRPNKASVTVYKLVQGQRCPFTASARWREYYPGGKEAFMWDGKPCLMLGKVAEALALRKAFPAELSGIYTEDEMAQADAGAEIKGTAQKPVAIEVVKTLPSNPTQNVPDLLKSISGLYDGFLKVRPGYSIRKHLKDHYDGKDHHKLLSPDELQEFVGFLQGTIAGKPPIDPLYCDAMEEAVRAVETFQSDKESQHLYNLQSERFNHSRV